MAKIDVSNIFPINKMKLVTVDGQAVIELPKTWIRNTPLAKGATYEDKVAYMFSERAQPGYHLAPSFYTDGKENENGVQLSAYIASRIRQEKQLLLQELHLGPALHIQRLMLQRKPEIQERENKLDGVPGISTTIICWRDSCFSKQEVQTSRQLLAGRMAVWA